MTSFRLAFLNLIRRRVPTAIAIIAIAISVASSGVLLKLYLLSDSRFSTLGHGGDAVIGAKSGNLDILLGSLNLEGEYPDFIPLVLYESLKAKQTTQFEDGTIAQSDFTKQVIPFVYFGQFEGFRIIGTDHSFLERPSYLDTVKLGEGRWADATGEAVIGSYVAKDLHLTIGQTLNAKAWTGRGSLGPEFPLKVVGILDSTQTAWDRAIYSSLAQAHTTLEQNVTKGQSIWGANVLNYYLVYLENDASLTPLTNLINRRTVAQVISVPREIEHLKELTGTGKQFGLFMTILIMFLGGLSVAGMMVTRFDSMSVQMAVLRAIGYDRKKISGWLLWEGFLLGLAACVLGGAIDSLSFPLIRAFLGTALPPESQVSISFLMSWPVWVTAILATIIAVFIPLVRLYRQDVNEALHA